MDRPVSKRPRGAALASILTLAALMIVVAMAVAAVCLNSLHVAQAFRDGAEGELLARAAAEEFIRTFSGSSADATALEGKGGDPLRDYYDKNPVFKNPGKLGADVRVTFDPSKPYYSVNNSQNDQGAASWSDRGTGRKSVPPYSISLVTTIRSGQRTLHYETILQRRWPYVLAVPDTVTMTGTPFGGTKEKPPDRFMGASTVIGPLFLTGVPISVHNPSEGSLTLDDRPILDPLTGGTQGRPAAVVPLDEAMYEEVIRSQSALPSTARVMVGTSSGWGPTAAILSKGNALKGRVDFSTAAPNWWGGAPASWVKVMKLPESDPPENLWDPDEARVGIGTRAQLEALRKQIFTPPAPGGTKIFTGLSGFPENPEESKGRQFYLLDSTLRLKARNPGPDPSQIAGENRYYVDGSLGNRYLGLHKVWEESPDGGDPVESWRFEEKAESGKSIELDGVLLDINGNLDLSSEPKGKSDPDYPLADDDPPVPGLFGNNATVIVRGTLVINHGVLQAADQGMVIYCQRLVMKASGSYRGLILVEESALFYPSGTPDARQGLRIEGAIICGGWPFLVIKHQPPKPRAEPTPDPSPSPGASPSASPTPDPSPSPTLDEDVLEMADVSGLRLWGTHLEYNPRFLKNLHQFGDFHLLMMRKLP